MLPWYTNTALNVLIFYQQVLDRTKKETQAAMLLSEHRLKNRPGLDLGGYWAFLNLCTAPVTVVPRSLKQLLSPVL